MTNKKPAVPPDGADKAAKAARRAEQRAAARAAAEDAAQAEADALDARRAAQRAEADEAVRTLEMQRRDVMGREQQRHTLDNHLHGLYAEVDKLAKGRAMSEVTALIMTQTNEGVRDAKAIVEGDPYLDRVKEFVAAGNYPVYPDVLVALRTVRQALARAADTLKARREALEPRMHEARTLAIALRMTMETGEPPTLRDVRAQVPHSPDDIDDAWFSLDEVEFSLRDDGFDAVFNLEHLDTYDSPLAYLTRVDDA